MIKRESMSYSLLLLNGGVGSRVKSNEPKQLIKINGVPMIVYSLVSACAVDEFDEIIVNYPVGYKDTIKDIVSDYSISKKVVFVEAGQTRQESVCKMLSHCKNNSIILHESARPLVTKEQFQKLINSEHANVGLMTKIPFTVAPVDPKNKKVTGNLDREMLRNVQLPQKFSLADLKNAHEWAMTSEKQYTEDATLCADYGLDVFFLEGSESNIKVTNPNDIRIAGFLLGDKESE